MPEYLAPGVYVEETSFRSRAITGVSTSVAALVGPTKTGPIRGVPEVITSFGEFERIYGGLDDLTFENNNIQPNYTAHAARAFFDNGGKQLYVSRVFKEVNSTDENGNGGSALSSTSDTALTNKLTFSSRFAGEAGNVLLEVRWRDGQNLFTSKNTTEFEEGEVLYLKATHIEDVQIDEGNGSKDFTFTLKISALVEVVSIEVDPNKTKKEFKLISGVINDKHDNAVTISRDQDGALVLTGNLKDDSGPQGRNLSASELKNLDAVTVLTTASNRLTRVKLRTPVSGALKENDTVVVQLSREVDLTAYTGGGSWGTSRVLRGALSADLKSISIRGLDSEINLPLAALAVDSGDIVAALVLRTFDLDIRKYNKDGEIIYTYANVSTASNAVNSIDKVMPMIPDSRGIALVSPVACKLENETVDVLEELYKLFDTKALTTDVDPLLGPRYLIQLSGGTDGESPESGDYAGEEDEQGRHTGLAALALVEDISIVATPAAAADKENHQAIVLELQKHCNRMRYRMGIVDARKGMTISEIREFRSNFDDSRLALYYPWVQTADPLGIRNELPLPPSGFIAGIYARTDVQRGVHKAPANTPVYGALSFSQAINSYQQEVLNPEGINCLRSFAGRGHRVWGARTLSSDPEWVYLNVRRYFLFLERSIEKSTQWAVFEPNGEQLWESVRISVENFLYNEWYQGHLLGGSPAEAYFVRCDRTTMTQNDIDNGRLICEVGVAALKPAEFVIFRIGQKTALLAAA